MRELVCIVQARMGSSRLPGKVLADIDGEPMLAFMLRRLMRGAPGEVVLATSTGASDDPVAELGSALGVTVVRGSEADVLSRFADVVRSVPAETVVRLTADCPLHDPELVAQAVARHHAVGADYTSNTLVRTYPDGLDVEVMRAEMLLEAERDALDPPEREHVTPFFYRRPERYSLAAIRNDEPLGDERWTVDTKADLMWVRDVVARLPADAFAWRDVLEITGRQRRPGPGQLHLCPAVDSVPEARVWEVRQDGEVLGRLRVPVIDGIGALEARVSDDVYHAALRLLHQALQADLQVRHLAAPELPQT